MRAGSLTKMPMWLNVICGGLAIPGLPGISQRDILSIEIAEVNL